ncbi:hypothetical protein LY76DRAFT_585835 [Colletotrichum caudatum]|nr:hypothetical protein LY76DRAFT_585835 [Colletotrichum caudatum]
MSMFPIDWAYQSTHLHAHSHDGGPMRASDHCFRGTALMLMSASGSPKTKGACDGVDESQRQEHCIVDVVEILENVSVRSHGGRCGAGGLSKPDLMQVIVISVRQHVNTRAALAACQKGLPFRTCQGEANWLWGSGWLICGEICNHHPWVGRITVGITIKALVCRRLLGGPPLS